MQRDAQNLKRSQMLWETLAQHRELLIDRLIESGDVALVAAVRALKEFEEMLNERIDRALRDGDANATE